MGNWTESADLGGEPKQLSHSDPATMHSVLMAMSKNKEGIPAIYEATHHGPLLNTPSFFSEFGGSESDIQNSQLGNRMGAYVVEGLKNINDGKHSFNKIAIGIGGGHYSEKFTKIAIEKEYAFSYILPKYVISKDDNFSSFDRLEQALKRSNIPNDIAVIEWKGLNSISRQIAIKKLENLGIDYEKL
jgi:D-aminoacyl-tRNA deacylase